MAKLDSQYFLLPVATFCTTSIYLAGPLESLTGTLNEHTSCLNPADPLTVTGSADITSVLSPVKHLCSWTPPIESELGKPWRGAAIHVLCMTHASGAWRLLLWETSCKVFTFYREYVLSQELFGFGITGGVEWGWGGSGGQELSRAKDLHFLLKISILRESPLCNLIVWQLMFTGRGKSRKHW